eukprot:TRINITY_DN6979_c0_g1_i15.p3 TRINITY_DN6979_c0_g1~~TRINITY_DN6979_c0_g1_i15.p3  ORF type:complete len:148 (-),score=0.83 TRINITY_DN6979_c0_g1_i15:74-517(-)
MEMPSFFTVSRSLQQSSIPSLNHLHTPFQFRRGSILKAFNTIHSEVKPQNAGSSQLLNYSINLKNPSIVPQLNASWNIYFPYSDEKAIAGSLRSRLQKEQDLCQNICLLVIAKVFLNIAVLITFAYALLPTLRNIQREVCIHDIIQL